MLAGTNHLLDLKKKWNRAKNPLHKKAKSERQVVKSPQSPFFLKLSDKNKLEKMLNYLSKVGALRWVAYRNLAYQFFFFKPLYMVH